MNPKDKDLSGVIVDRAARFEPYNGKGFKYKITGNEKTLKHIFDKGLLKMTKKPGCSHGYVREAMEQDHYEVYMIGIEGVCRAYIDKSVPNDVILLRGAKVR